MLSSEVVVKCGDKFETREVLSFSIFISDGQGGFTSQAVEGNKISSMPESFSETESGSMIVVEKIVLSGDEKTKTIGIAPMQIP